MVLITMISKELLSQRREDREENRIFRRVGTAHHLPKVDCAHPTLAAHVQKLYNTPRMPEW